MNSEPSTIPPFSYFFTPQISEILRSIKCSIMISTYQAGKLVIISPAAENKLISLSRTFSKPMGFDVAGDRMIVATKDEVIYLENSPQLAANYPNRPGQYDSLFAPKITFHTGFVDMHDIAFGKEGIWAVNTSFSCLCLLAGVYNFTPKWTPPFVTDLVSEDRCHLNGLVMENGEPKYVTGLGQTNTARGWKNCITNGGFLMDVTTNEVILEKLAMPHSPTVYKGELYLLLSASGEVIKVNVKEKKYDVIINLNGFCRGLDIYGDLMFVGMSKIRKSSSSFSQFPFSEQDLTAGVKIIHLPTKTLIGEIAYQTSVDEIYDVRILKNTIRPNILNTINPMFKYSLSIPGQTFWAKPESND